MVRSLTLTLYPVLSTPCPSSQGLTWGTWCRKYGVHGFGDGGTGVQVTQFLTALQWLVSETNCNWVSDTDCHCDCEWLTLSHSPSHCQCHSHESRSVTESEVGDLVSLEYRCYYNDRLLVFDRKSGWPTATYVIHCRNVHDWQTSITDCQSRPDFDHSRKVLYSRLPRK